MTIPLLHWPGHLIAAIPQLFGHEPHECVVVVGVAESGEMKVAIRVERERLMLPDLGPTTAADIARTMHKDDVTRAFLVSWTRERVDVECPAAAVAREYLTDVYEVSDAWATNGDYYWSPGCADHECCPVGGRPVPVAPRIDGAVPRVSMAHRRSSLRTTEATQVRRNAARAAQRWLTRRHGDRDAWCASSWEHVQASMEATVPPPTWGKAMAGLSDVRVRDALIVSWLGADADVIADVLAGRATQRVNEVMDGALRPSGARLPRDEETERALVWCDRLAECSRTSDLAVVLTLKAVLSWWTGQVEACRVHVSQALAVDDSYTLAMLLRSMCDAGLQPGWMRQ
ncbi:DUF4192 family protein [Demequina globuliformis]|uniref:DUF4192 family protein n=1 Tax=Demequina globuliformis TaxID=676202 RepID=UPI000784322E|nr:DUF4192 family protein [Demequina globuliformis]